MPIGAVIGAAAIGGAASLAGGAMQANAANQASQVQASAADKSLALQKEQYDQSRSDSLPWMESGKTALNAYMGELGLSDEAKAGTFKSGFTETPGYKFQVQEGQKAALNNLSALGMKNSGAALKSLQSRGQGLAQQTYDNYLNRLSAASTGGQATVANQNALGANYAQNAGNTVQDKAAATASGYVGGANAWSNALGNVSNQAGWALGMSGGNFGGGGGGGKAANSNGLRLGYQAGV